MKFKANEHKFTKKSQKEKIDTENYIKIFNIILNNEKELLSDPNRINQVDDGKIIPKKSTQNIVKKKIQHIIKINPLKSLTKESVSIEKHKKLESKKKKSNSKSKKTKTEYHTFLQKKYLKIEKFLANDEGINSSTAKTKDFLTSKKIKNKKKLINFSKNEDNNDEYFSINNTMKTTNKGIKIKEKIIQKNSCKKQLKSPNKKIINKIISPVNNKFYDKNIIKPKSKGHNIDKNNSNNSTEFSKLKINKISSKFTNKFTKNLNFNKIKINDNKNFNYNPDTIINQTTNNNINNINYTFSSNISSKKFIVNNANNNISINININNINNNTLKNNKNINNISNKEIIDNQMNDFPHFNNKKIHLTKNKSANITTLNFLNYNKEAQQIFDYIPDQLINEQNINYLYGKGNNPEIYSYQYRKKSENFLHYTKDKGIKVESININLCKDTNKSKRNYNNISSNTNYKDYEGSDEYDDYLYNQSSMNLSIKSAMSGSKKLRRLSRERDKYKLLHSNHNDFVDSIDKKLSNIVSEFHKNIYEDDKSKKEERIWKKGKSHGKSASSLNAVN